MAENSKIEWTTLPEQTDILKGKTICEQFTERDAVVGHPFPNIPVSLGTITAPACRKNVARSRASSLRDGDNVIPCIGEAAAVGAPAIKNHQQEPLGFIRNSVNASLAVVGKLPKAVSELRVGRIVVPSLGIGAFLADAVSCRRPVNNPLTAGPAPSFAMSAPQFAFLSQRPVCSMAMAEHAPGGKAVVPSFVSAKSCLWSPFSTRNAVLESSIRDELVVGQ